MYGAPCPPCPTSRRADITLDNAGGFYFTYGQLYLRPVIALKSVRTVSAHRNGVFWSRLFYTAYRMENTAVRINYRIRAYR